MLRRAPARCPTAPAEGLLARRDAAACPHQTRGAGSCALRATFAAGPGTLAPGGSAWRWEVGSRRRCPSGLASPAESRSRGRPRPDGLLRAAVTTPPASRRACPRWAEGPALRARPSRARRTASRGWSAPVVVSAAPLHGERGLTLAARPVRLVDGAAPSGAKPARRCAPAGRRAPLRRPRRPGVAGEACDSSGVGRRVARGPPTPGHGGRGPRLGRRSATNRHEVPTSHTARAGLAALVHAQTRSLPPSPFHVERRCCPPRGDAVRAPHDVRPRRRRPRPRRV